MNMTATDAAPGPRDPEQLLRDLAWVQRLALRLCSNAALAEDLRQEAAVAALGGAVPAEGPTRRWLAGVVRKRLLMARRTGARRSARETVVARPEALLAEVDVVERAEVQAVVSEAVLGLHEPYRTVVLRRYFDEWTPAEIAERTGTPIDTVKSRLKRGLEQLEDRLGRRFGATAADVRERTGWYGALLPLAVMESQRRAQLAGAAAGAVASSLPWLSTLTLAMSLKFLALPAILLAFFFLFRASRHGGASAFDDVSVAQSASAPDAQRRSVSPDAAAELASAEDRQARERTSATDAPVMTTASDRALELAVVTGRVLDTFGRPVESARVSARTGAPMPPSARGSSFSAVTTDSDGRFRFEADSTEPGAFWLHIEAGPYERPEYLEFGTGSAGARLPLVHGVNDVGTLVLEGAGVIKGRVIGEDGRPSTTATVQIIGEGHRQTERDGSFELAGLLPMSATVRAYTGTSLLEEQAVFVAPRSTVEGIELRLRTAPLLEGQVIDESGAPVQGALIRMESVDDILERTALSDADGRFRIPFTHIGEAELEVEADGFEKWDAAESDLRIDPSSPAVRVGLKRSEPVAEESEPAVASEAATVSPSTFTGAALHGRVLRNGAPASDAFIKVESGNRMGERMARLRGSDNPDEFLATGLFDRLVRVSADGTFRIEGLGAAYYRLSISSWRTTTLELPVVKLRRGESMDLGSIEIPDGGRVRGHAVLPPGVSPLGLTVTCGKGLGAVHGLLDDGARFDLSGVPPGRQEVKLSGRAGVLDEGDAVIVDVVSGSTSDVVLDASGLALVALRLRFDLGSVSPAGYRALLRPVDDPKAVLLNEFLDAEGRIGSFVRSVGKVAVHLVDRNLDHVQGPAWTLRLVAGGAVDDVITFQFGTLALDFGPDKRVPRDGELHVRLRTPDGAATSEFSFEVEDAAPLDLDARAARWSRLADGGLRLQLDRAPVGTFDVTVTMFDLDRRFAEVPPGTGAGAAAGELWLDAQRLTVRPR